MPPFAFPDYTYAGNVIPLPEFKILLGSAVDNLSDEEILRIRDGARSPGRHCTKET